MKEGLRLTAWRGLIRSTLVSISTPWVECAERVLLKSLVLVPSRKVCRWNVNRTRRVNKVMILLDRKGSVCCSRKVCQATRVITGNWSLLFFPCTLGLANILRLRIIVTDLNFSARRHLGCLNNRCLRSFPNSRIIYLSPYNLLILYY